jgi:hypothetical protein
VTVSRKPPGGDPCRTWAGYLTENADEIAQDIMRDWKQLGEEQPWRRVPEYPAR